MEEMAFNWDLKFGQIFDMQMLKRKAEKEAIRKLEQHLSIMGKRMCWTIMCQSIRRREVENVFRQVS